MAMYKGCQLSPHRAGCLDCKMETAVVGGDITTVVTLLDDGFHVNHQLHGRGGDTALHLATQLARHGVVKTLVRHGADPLARNAAAASPVSLAVANGDAVMLELLLTHADRLRDLADLWLQKTGSCLLWRDASDVVMATLVRCSPDLGASRSNVYNNVLHRLRVNNMAASLIAFVAAGNPLNDKQLARFDPVTLRPFLTWLAHYRRSVQPLSHHCRLAVRRAMYGRCNVFYGATRLPLPKPLQDFVCLRDDQAKLGGTNSGI